MNRLTDNRLPSVMGSSVSASCTETAVQDDGELAAEADINDVDRLHDVAQTPPKSVLPQAHRRVQNETPDLALLQVGHPSGHLHVGFFLQHNTGELTVLSTCARIHQSRLHAN